MSLRSPPRPLPHPPPAPLYYGMTTPHSRIPYLPARIEGLAALAMNLWWSWSREARAPLPLHRRSASGITPVTTRSSCCCRGRSRPASPRAPATATSCAATTTSWPAWRTAPPASDTWFAQAYPELDGRPVAYFCAEFGLHNSVPIYSGGLGVLAGDHCKARQRSRRPAGRASGLFYMKGYFDQRLRLDGWQEDSDEEFDLSLHAARAGDRRRRQEPWLTTVRDLRPPGPRAGLAHAWWAGCRSTCSTPTSRSNHPDDRALMNKLYAGGPRSAAPAGVDPRRRRRARAPGGGHRPGGLARQRGPRGVHDGRAAAGATSPAALPFEEAVHAGARAQRVHHPHAGAGGARRLRARAARERAPARSGRSWASTASTFFALGAPPRAAATQFHMTVRAMRLAARRERRVPAARPGVPQSLARPLARPALGSGADRPRHQRRAPRHLDGEPHHGAARRASGRRLGRAGSTTPALWDQVLTLDHAELWEAHLRLKQILAQLHPRGRAAPLRRPAEGSRPGGRRRHAARSRRRSPSASRAGSPPTSAPT